jgi:hypothetical protein
MFIKINLLVNFPFFIEHAAFRAKETFLFKKSTFGCHIRIEAELQKNPQWVMLCCARWLQMYVEGEYFPSLCSVPFSFPFPLHGSVTLSWFKNLT